jgi:hypothetical protein
MVGSQLRLCWSEAVCSTSGYRLMSAVTALSGHATRRQMGTNDLDRFRVREWCLLLMLSYLHLALLRLVRARPLVSVAVGRGRYSAGYSGRVL